MQQAVTLQHGSAADVGMDPARIELIRERARSWVTNGDTPSLVVLVARKGVIVLEEAYGIQRPTDSAPLRTDSIFPLCSITKPFTAAAIMSLVEDGLLSLKHPISDLIPEFTAPGVDGVLVVDLLTHTSGYDDLTVFPHVAERIQEGRPVPEAEPGQNPAINQIIRLAADAPLTRAPGEVMSYCNFGYQLLGDIVRRVSGEPLSVFARKRIFEPTGMRDAYLCLPRDLRRTRRVFRDARYPDIPDLFPPPNYPSEVFVPVDSEAWDDRDLGDVGAMATSLDVAAFAQMLLNGGAYAGRRILSRASVAAMTTPQLAPGTRAIFSMPLPGTEGLTEYPLRGVSYGLGLFMMTRNDRTTYFNGSLQSNSAFGHTGALVSGFWADPEEQVVGVYLSVQSKFRPNGIAFWHGDHLQDMVHAAIID